VPAAVMLVLAAISLISAIHGLVLRSAAASYRP
jgi:hypothetical protein